MIALLIATTATRPLLLAHVMPWFERTSTTSGFHWKMNLTDEQVTQQGKIASHYTPLTGSYDSLDRNVVEMQVQQIKLAGFDGIIADWYGPAKWYDYPIIHARTKLLFEVATRAGLSICVMYEDQTLRNAIKGNLIKPEEADGYAREAGKWIQENWINQPNWLQLQGRKALFVFGPQHLKKPGWDALLGACGSPALLTEHLPTDSSSGVFDWPVPKEGLQFNFDFPRRMLSGKINVAVAYPRFHDWYKQGGQGEGYGVLPDEKGETYRNLLQAGIQSKADAIQVATWNDWQEGTQIEPSKEFGVRDLISTQVVRRQIDPEFKFQSKDLGLPTRLYELRKAGPWNTRHDQASEALLKGDINLARSLIPASE
ncbi:MAG TPA: hypothetical protein VK171_06690 [Fimbriimonas sp.]|nr:hypothetical protein [Fimbriimonas sp.]